jgi:stage II sporulation protein D
MGADGRKLRALPANRPLTLVAETESGQVRLEGAGTPLSASELRLTAPLIQIGRRNYPGILRVRTGPLGLELVNELSVEQYLEGVLPGEIPAKFGVAAQRALAVAARSYALAQRGKHGEFDLCDETCCQMYLGMHRRTGRAIDAVRFTRGLCLWSGDDLAYGFYSADCGGESSRGEDVPLRDKPTGPLPYLRAVRDAPPGGAFFCASSPYHQWVKRKTRAEVEARLNARPPTFVGTLLSLEVTKYDPSGRMLEVRLRGDGVLPPPPVEPGAAPTPSPILSTEVTPPPQPAQSPQPLQPPQPVDKTVTGWELRRSLGARTLRSTLVKIDSPKPDEYRFLGRGNGHGLGLCQIGANGMAKQGYDFQRILAHYYPGASLRALPHPNVAATDRKAGAEQASR